MLRPRFLNWLTRQRVPTDSLRFHDLKRETRWLLWFSVLYIVASAATGLAIRAFPMPLWGATYFTQDIWYVVGFKITLLLTLPLIVWRHWGYRFSDLLYRMPNNSSLERSGANGAPPLAVGNDADTPTRSFRSLLNLRTLIVIAACFALGFFINAGRIEELKATYAMHTPPIAFARTAIGALLAWVMAGIPEEIVYRGMLQTHLEAAWGRVWAIIVSVILFTAWHIPTRYFLSTGVEGEAGDLLSVLAGTGAPVAIVALIFAFAWDRWRNLPALIAIHAGVDTIPIICSMLQSTAESYR